MSGVDSQKFKSCNARPETALQKGGKSGGRSLKKASSQCLTGW
ncbi:hypothetical protein [Candidatus Nitrososphaera gargensis]|nr:hypothetical protein [Candidatus Nitrososphaera gargensis]